MPNEAEMMAYAKSLPSIYRALMAAFPEVEPGRKAGYGLAFQTLAIHFINKKITEYSLGDIQQAFRQLAEEGFVEIKNGIFAHPTDLGEQLIAAVTDKPRATNRGIPPLPARNW